MGERGASPHLGWIIPDVTRCLDRHPEVADGEGRRALDRIQVHHGHSDDDGMVVIEPSALIVNSERMRIEEVGREVKHVVNLRKGGLLVGGWIQGRLKGLLTD